MMDRLGISRRLGDARRLAGACSARALWRWLALKALVARSASACLIPIVLGLLVAVGVGSLAFIGKLAWDGFHRVEAFSGGSIAMGFFGRAWPLVLTMSWMLCAWGACAVSLSLIAFFGLKARKALPAFADRSQAQLDEHGRYLESKIQRSLFESEVPRAAPEKPGAPPRL